LKKSYIEDMGLPGESNPARFEPLEWPIPVKEPSEIPDHAPEPEPVEAPEREPAKPEKEPVPA